ncbi:tRNA-uridine aminocarboxypropyltransferase 2 isoform X2 [Hippoglossus stenolepis]|uniref:tRNA-uridine aminocarboxypropyltransferase 2 isoform X2 n=1 Tax=Hippoglossus stenolepis TaxID=195615 RepID=UPI00159CA913|nr:tRNA-uridine aminocarboxypropyltransferase 2 isoform X2 [Hippoglossus stenolepis]
MEDAPRLSSTVSPEENGPGTCDSSWTEDGLVDAFRDLATLPVEVEERRPTCLRCRRPQKVCLCPFLPTQPLEVSTCLYVVQHPAEESRVLRTVPLLAACLPPGKCNVIVGRRFSEEKHPDLAALCRDSRTLILYPGPSSQNLEELVKYQEVGAVKHNIIIIDGTWNQAKSMFLKNSLFHLPKQRKSQNLSGYREGPFSNSPFYTGILLLLLRRVTKKASILLPLCVIYFFDSMLAFQKQRHALLWYLKTFYSI